MAHEVVLDILPGTDIKDATRDAIRMARRLDRRVKFTFNGNEITVYPDSRSSAVIEQFWQDRGHPSGEGTEAIPPETFSRAPEPIGRSELQALTTRARYFAETPGTNPEWVRTYWDLAHAASVLDAFIARSEM